MLSHDYAKNKSIIRIIVFCIITAFFYTMGIYKSYASTNQDVIDRQSIDIMSLVIAILGTILVYIEYRQLRKTKDIATAEFILSLNRTFVENKSFEKMYDLLDSYDFNLMPDLLLTNAEISNIMRIQNIFHMEKNLLKW